MESNTMLSWRGTTDGAGVVGTDFRELFILLLLGDSRIAKELRLKPRSTRSRCKSLRASDIGAGRANFMPAQAAGSNIQAANTMITPGVASTWTTRPAARCSLYAAEHGDRRGDATVMDFDFLPDMGRMNG